MLIEFRGRKNEDYSGAPLEVHFNYVFFSPIGKKLHTVPILHAEDEF